VNGSFEFFSHARKKGKKRAADHTNPLSILRRISLRKAASIQGVISFFFNPSLTWPTTKREKKREKGLSEILLKAGPP